MGSSSDRSCLFPSIQVISGENTFSYSYPAIPDASFQEASSSSTSNAASAASGEKGGVGNGHVDSGSVSTGFVLFAGNGVW